MVASAVAALDSWTKALGVIVFCIVYQQAENAYLTPRIMRATVDLPGAPLYQNGADWVINDFRQLSLDALARLLAAAVSRKQKRAG